jgi:hypothetical protein
MFERNGREQRPLSRAYWTRNQQGRHCRERRQPVQLRPNHIWMLAFATQGNRSRGMDPQEKAGLCTALKHLKCEVVMVPKIS